MILNGDYMNMKVIYNNVIPFKGFWAINLFGIIFARKEYGKLDPVSINHEEIHTAQMKELLYIFFYILYFSEWIYRLIFHTATAYFGLSFEKEAYENSYNLRYLETRKKFAMWRKK